MRRRQFLAALGGMAAGPLASYAQGPGLPLIGYLGPEAPERFASRVNAFRDGLAETGYIEGRNVGIEFRWADGDYQKLPALAADLASRQVAVMVAPGGAPNALAAKLATTTIPIVFEMGGDPVALGIVPNLSQPGGNLTAYRGAMRTPSQCPSLRPRLTAEGTHHVERVNGAYKRQICTTSKRAR